MSFANLGKVWSTDTFSEYLKTVPRPSWVKSITIHHTAAPSLAQRPQGFNAQNVANIASYYRNKLGWNRGPHLFTDEDQIFGMTPLTVKGIHAASFNSSSIGIEVLGNYDIEPHNEGRGAHCWLVAAQTTALLLQWLGLPANKDTVKFHRDDPKTSKTCPGKRISKEWFLSLIANGYSKPVAPADDLKVAPVVAYAVEHKGYTYASAVALLKAKRGLFFFGDDWLEGAFYDKSLGQTVAPLDELEAIKPA